MADPTPRVPSKTPTKTRSERGKSGVRAVWADLESEMARDAGHDDPFPEAGRNGVAAGQWDGFPAAKLPPGCPVVPLGLLGKLSYYVDTSGQLIDVGAGEWSKKLLLHLFAGHHNYLEWAWPKWSVPNDKGKKDWTINGVEVDQVVKCMLTAAQRKGIFSSADRVRGRGAWQTRSGGLIWHGGDRIYRIEGGRIEASGPGEIDGIFYPNLPVCTAPWAEPVSPETSPAREILAALCTWNWERPLLDPILVLGGIGVSWLGAALEWRPHLFMTGDAGVGKSTLHKLLKGLFGASLLATADTTPAGIYQAVNQDCLPVAIDELEADADNRRAKGVITLARLASSGAVMYRGGADHSGVNFTMRNAFVFSAINPPPLEAADKSRLAMLNLGRLDQQQVRKPLTIDAEVTGRMMLRSLMDRWHEIGDSTTPGKLIHKWRAELAAGGVNARGQDTWGTLLAIAEALVGLEGLDAVGFPVFEGEPGHIGRVVAQATAYERQEAQENWVDCFDYLLGSRIDAWKDGEKPTIGGVIEAWERPHDAWTTEEANRRLALVGLKLLEHVPGVPTERRRLLAVPTSAEKAPQLAAIYRDKKWSSGVWGSALKQAPKDVIWRDLGNGQKVKINRVTMHCLLVDLENYDRWKDQEGKSP